MLVPFVVTHLEEWCLISACAYTYLFKQMQMYACSLMPLYKFCEWLGSGLLILLLMVAAGRVVFIKHKMKSFSPYLQYKQHLKFLLYSQNNCAYAADWNGIMYIRVRMYIDRNKGKDNGDRNGSNNGKRMTNDRDKSNNNNNNNEICLQQENRLLVMVFVCLHQLLELTCLPVYDRPTHIPIYHCTHTYAYIYLVYVLYMEVIVCVKAHIVMV